MKAMQEDLRVEDESYSKKSVHSSLSFQKEALIGTTNDGSFQRLDTRASSSCSRAIARQGSQFGGEATQATNTDDKHAINEVSGSQAREMRSESLVSDSNNQCLPKNQLVSAALSTCRKKQNNVLSQNLLSRKDSDYINSNGTSTSYSAMQGNLSKELSLSKSASLKSSKSLKKVFSKKPALFHGPSTTSTIAESSVAGVSNLRSRSETMDVSGDASEVSQINVKLSTSLELKGQQVKSPDSSNGIKSNESQSLLGNSSRGSTSKSLKSVMSRKTSFQQSQRSEVKIVTSGAESQAREGQNEEAHKSSNVSTDDCLVSLRGSCGTSSKFSKLDPSKCNRKNVIQTSSDVHFDLEDANSETEVGDECLVSRHGSSLSRMTSSQQSQRIDVEKLTPKTLQTSRAGYQVREGDNEEARKSANAATDDCLVPVPGRCGTSSEFSKLDPGKCNRKNVNQTSSNVRFDLEDSSSETIGGDACLVSLHGSSFKKSAVLHLHSQSESLPIGMYQDSTAKAALKYRATSDGDILVDTVPQDFLAGPQYARVHLNTRSADNAPRTSILEPSVVNSGSQHLHSDSLKVTSVIEELEQSSFRPPVLGTQKEPRDTTHCRDNSQNTDFEFHVTAFNRERQDGERDVTQSRRDLNLQPEETSGVRSVRSSSEQKSSISVGTYLYDKEKQRQSVFCPSGNLSPSCAKKELAPNTSAAYQDLTRDELVQKLNDDSIGFKERLAIENAILIHSSDKSCSSSLCSMGLGIPALFAGSACVWCLLHPKAEADPIEVSDSSREQGKQCSISMDREKQSSLGLQEATNTKDEIEAQVESVVGSMSSEEGYDLLLKCDDSDGMSMITMDTTLRKPINSGEDSGEQFLTHDREGAYALAEADSRQAPQLLGCATRSNHDTRQQDDPPKLKSIFSRFKTKSKRAQRSKHSNAAISYTKSGSTNPSIESGVQEDTPHIDTIAEELGKEIAEAEYELQEDMADIYTIDENGSQEGFSIRERNYEFAAEKEDLENPSASNGTFSQDLGDAPCIQPQGTAPQNNETNQRVNAMAVQTEATQDALAASNTSSPIALTDAKELQPETIKGDNAAKTPDCIASNGSLASKKVSTSSGNGSRNMSKSFAAALSEVGASAAISSTTGSMANKISGDRNGDSHIVAPGLSIERSSSRVISSNHVKDTTVAEHIDPQHQQQTHASVVELFAKAGAVTAMSNTDVATDSQEEIRRSQPQSATTFFVKIRAKKTTSEKHKKSANTKSLSSVESKGKREGAHNGKKKNALKTKLDHTSTKGFTASAALEHGGPDSNKTLPVTETTRGHIISLSHSPEGVDQENTLSADDSSSRGTKGPDQTRIDGTTGVAPQNTTNDTPADDSTSRETKGPDPTKIDGTTKEETQNGEKKESRSSNFLSGWTAGLCGLATAGALVGQSFNKDSVERDEPSEQNEFFKGSGWTAALAATTATAIAFLAPSSEDSEEADAAQSAARNLRLSSNDMNNMASKNKYSEPIIKRQANEYDALKEQDEARKQIWPQTLERRKAATRAAAGLPKQPKEVTTAASGHSRRLYIRKTTLTTQKPPKQGDRALKKTENAAKVQKGQTCRKAESLDNRPALVERVHYPKVNSKVNSMRALKNETKTAKKPAEKTLRKKDTVEMPPHRNRLKHNMSSKAPVKSETKLTRNSTSRIKVEGGLISEQNLTRKNGLRQRPKKSKT
jgi:hypothetical protein